MSYINKLNNHKVTRPPHFPTTRSIMALQTPRPTYNQAKQHTARFQEWLLQEAQRESRNPTPLRILKECAALVHEKGTRIPRNILRSLRKAVNIRKTYTSWCIENAQNTSPDERRAFESANVRHIAFNEFLEHALELFSAVEEAPPPPPPRASTGPGSIALHNAFSVLSIDEDDDREEEEEDYQDDSPVVDENEEDCQDGLSVGCSPLPPPPPPPPPAPRQETTNQPSPFNETDENHPCDLATDDSSSRLSRLLGDTARARGYIRDLWSRGRDKLTQGFKKPFGGGGGGIRHRSRRSETAAVDKKMSRGLKPG
ncbi:hypothetical protein M426DRAFT_230505 [Hypoxylon sp. CI-4A]|nr:hypothetical protein M426DRAFT_230505 [Hypoxylon sp. CI-4A]